MSRSVKLQLCIVLDTTRSMINWLDAAKQSCSKLFTDIPSEVEKLKPHCQLEMSLAIVAYKDVEDKDHPKVSNFATNHGSALQMLETLSGDGGGDYPEDIGGALQKVNGLEWDRAIGTYKVLVHFFDAPPHGSDYNDLLPKDDHHHADAAPTAQFVKELAEKRVDYVMIRCGSPVDHRWTTKYAGMCADIYGDVWNDEARSRTRGRMPFVESFELESSLDMAAHLLPIIVSASTCSMGQMTPSISILPKADGLASGTVVPKVFSTSIPPKRGWDYVFYPNDFFKVENRTSFDLLLAVFPDVPRHKNEPSSLHFSVDTSGVSAGATFAHILAPLNVPTQRIPVSRSARAECGAAGGGDVVYMQSKKGVYLSICRTDVPGHEGKDLIVGSELAWVKKGTTLVLWSNPDHRPK
jgi:hypothetical protein